MVLEVGLEPTKREAREIYSLLSLPLDDSSNQSNMEPRPGLEPGNLILTMDALYQLSYRGNKYIISYIFKKWYN